MEKEITIQVSMTEVIEISDEDPDYCSEDCWSKVNNLCFFTNSNIRILDGKPIRTPICRKGILTPKKDNDNYTLTVVRIPKPFGGKCNIRCAFYYKDSYDRRICVRNYGIIKMNSLNNEVLVPTIRCSAYKYLDIPKEKEH